MTAVRVVLVCLAALALLGAGTYWGLVALWSAIVGYLLARKGDKTDV